MSNKAESSTLVRVGRGFTQVYMSKEDRHAAVEAAHWRTCSPVEWTWSPNQQALMAMYCLWASQRLAMIQDISGGKELVHEPEGHG